MTLRQTVAINVPNPAGMPILFVAFTDFESKEAAESKAAELNEYKVGELPLKFFHTTLEVIW